MTTNPPADTEQIARRRRRVLLATGVGTTIEWYDFFLYALCAGLVFAPVFFAPAGDSVAILLSFATIGISFLFRPLGAILAGHFGDRIGRKGMLVATVFLMGGATTLIGFVPSFEQIGIAAPLILIALRILQGLSAGGEWGGAALMAVESAPRERRARWGSSPQQGAPIGLIIAMGALAIVSAASPSTEWFLTWGWRIPFFFSAILIVVGYVIRRSLEESPVFSEMRATGDVQRVPIARLFRRHLGLVLIAALVYAGNSGTSYLVAGGFLQSYVTSDAVANPLAPSTVLTIVTITGVVWIIALYVSAALADRIGRRTTYIIGWVLTAVATFPLIAAMESANPVWLFLAVSLYMAGNMFTYGPMAAFFSELFPADVRYTGIAISYAIGSILGGAFAPTIATALVQATGTVYSVGIYAIALIAVSLVATLLLRDRRGIDLGPDVPAAQDLPIYGVRQRHSAPELADVRA